MEKSQIEKDLDRIENLQQVWYRHYRAGKMERWGSEIEMINEWIPKMTRIIRKLARLAEGRKLLKELDSLKD